MSHIYRCMRCRTRNTFSKPVAAFVRGRSCRHCANRTFYVDKERMGRVGCTCGGYYFPHRPGSGACVTSKTHAVHIAKRGGDKNEIAEAIMECAVENGVFTMRCPF